MRTEVIKLYTFSELSEEVQQKVIERFLDINVSHDWWVSTYEDAEQIGLKLTSFDLDRNRNAQGEFIISANEVAQNILNSHGESCETFKTAQNFMEDWQPIFNNYMDESSEGYESSELEAEIQELEYEFLESLLEDYSIMLQNESEYLMSDEAIIETIEANEYEFLENGEQI